MVSGNDSEGLAARTEFKIILSRMIGRALKEQRHMSQNSDDQLSAKDQAKKIREYAEKHGLGFEIPTDHRLSREELEALAVDEICACRYYDLQDTLQETPDEDLLLIINHTVKCEICGD